MTSEDLDRRQLVASGKIEVSLEGKFSTRAGLSAQASVQIWRNQGLERIVSSGSSLLMDLGCSVEFNFSDYDDSLSFQEFRDADAHIVWLDSARYSPEIKDSFESFLIPRFRALRELTSAPIVVVDETGSLQEESFSSLGVSIANLAVFAEQHGLQLFDDRWLGPLGSRINPHASSPIARWFGLRVVGSLFFPQIKLVALDLDGTLYDGVLGEDGIAGLSFGENHSLTQELLSELRDHGVFLTLISKNHLDDVQALFLKRRELKLSLGDFLFPKIGWASKPESLAEICSQLNIGADSVLFLDDNPAEILAMRNRLPDVNSIQIDSGGALAAHVLSFWPGLWPRSKGAGPERIKDIRAKADREVFERAFDSRSSYLDSLKMEVQLSYDQETDVIRAAELSHKTNQFNLALARLSEQELRTIVRSADQSLVLGSLSDKFANLGSIMFLIAQIREKKIYVDEICFSCRALGRGIETKIVYEALSDIIRVTRSTSVFFRASKGHRNGPALAWLESLGTISSAFGAPRYYEVQTERMLELAGSSPKLTLVK